MAVAIDELHWVRAARRGWREHGDKLIRDFTFRDFDDGLRFIEQVGRRAEDHKRHPEMSIAAYRVRLTIANPHHAGITLAELRLAAKVNEVVEDLAP
jgi:pterin-4a-carbinolamine dehydratase